MAPLQQLTLQFLSFSALVFSADSNAPDLGPNVHAFDKTQLKLANPFLQQNSLLASFSVNPGAVPFNRSGYPALAARQTGGCAGSDVSCYSTCIPSGDTCCTGGGGCSTGYYCDALGCCPNGQVCNGLSGDCQRGDKSCGTGCIDESATCCPDESSGCPSGTFCSLSSSGTYGCCNNGETCNGSTGGGSGGSGGGSGSGSSSTCDPGRTECGQYCILTTSTCCPDLDGGCFAGDYCYLKTDGSYGCCENGETCSGAAGGSGGSGGGSGNNTSSTCDPGRTECGDYCILTTSTCCPDLQGGCFAGDYCYLKTDGSYGCCENGETCTGAAAGGGSGSASGSSTTTRTTTRGSTSTRPPTTTSTTATPGAGGSGGGVPASTGTALSASSIIMSWVMAMLSWIWIV